METTEPPIVDILTPQQKERFKELQQKLQFRLRLGDTIKENAPHEAPPPPQSRGKEVSRQTSARG